VQDVDRLIDYVEHTMDEIERHRLGMSGDLFNTLLSCDELDGSLAC